MSSTDCYTSFLYLNFIYEISLYDKTHVYILDIIPMKREQSMVFLDHFFDAFIALYYDGRLNAWNF